MEQKVKGGKRKGAGRKPIGNLNKKKQVTFFIEGGIILKFGNEEKLKEQGYKFFKEYGEVVVAPAPENGFDAPLKTIINDEYRPDSKSLLPIDNFLIEATNAKSRTELEDVLKRAKKELGFFPYQKLTDAVKPLFDNFFND